MVLWWAGTVVGWYCGGIVLWWDGAVVGWYCGGIVLWWDGAVVGWYCGGIVLWWFLIALFGFLVGGQSTEAICLRITSRSVGFGSWH